MLLRRKIVIREKEDEKVKAQGRKTLDRKKEGERERDADLFPREQIGVHEESSGRGHSA